MASALTLTQLESIVSERLGSTSTYYPEAEVVTGLNAAANLLVLLDNTLLVKRITASVAAQQAFIDLRSAAARLVRLERVLLGTVTADDPRRSLGQVDVLKPTSRAALRWRSASWFTHTGVPKQWYLHGRHLVGLYPRAA